MSPKPTLITIAVALVMASAGAPLAQPAITVPAIDDIGAGLQSGGLFAVLGEAEHGGVTVHVESSNPSIALVSGNVNAAGESSVDVNLNNGITSALFYVHGVDGAAGSASIIVTAPGFAAAVTPVQVVTPALFIDQLVEQIDLDDPDDEFRIRVGTPTADSTAIEHLQNVRAGSPGLEVTVSSSDVIVGRLQTAEYTAGVVSVTIPAGRFISPLSVAMGGIAFQAINEGTCLVTATAPGYITTTGAARSVSVTDAFPSPVKPTVTRIAHLENFPNPFNPSTTIRFDLAEAGHVSLRIYDVAGRLVRELLNDYVSAGETALAWDGRNNRGETVASGVYIYRVQSDGESAIRRMILVK